MVKIVDDGEACPICVPVAYQPKLPHFLSQNGKNLMLRGEIEVCLNMDTPEARHQILFNISAQGFKVQT